MPRARVQARNQPCNGKSGLTDRRALCYNGEMTNSSTLTALLCTLPLLFGGLQTWAQEPADDTPAVEQTAEATEVGGDALPGEQDKMQWWREARLGMFIHYGLYSGLAGVYKGEHAGGEWIQTNVGANTEEYAAEATPLFRPAKGCPAEWVKLAKEAGCRYVVLTTKHHEGFALFDSKLSDYTSAKLIGRDLVKEFTDACHEADMRVGFYHSVIDWHHPDYDNTICPDLCYPKGQAEMLKNKGIPRNQESYCRYLHGMVRELLTNYGKVDILWWDYSQGAAEGDRAWKATELKAMCRELQPGIIMNNRLYSAPTTEDGTPNGDFTTPEKKIPTRDSLPAYDWESCMTVGHHWGYSMNDGMFKSPAHIISMFEECLSLGGNFLLNIGPMVDGTVPEEQLTVFRALGDWMKVNSEAVYGSYPLTDIVLPEPLRAAIVQDNIYIYLPALTPEALQEVADLTFSVPAAVFDDVQPSILGQPDCKVTMRRRENPDNEEEAYLDFTIPIKAWKNGVQGMPVMKLEPGY